MLSTTFCTDQNTNKRCSTASFHGYVACNTTEPQTSEDPVDYFLCMLWNELSLTQQKWRKVQHRIIGVVAFQPDWSFWCIAKWEFGSEPSFGFSGVCSICSEKCRNSWTKRVWFAILLSNEIVSENTKLLDTVMTKSLKVSLNHYINSMLLPTPSMNISTSRGFDLSMNINTYGSFTPFSPSCISSGTHEA